MTRLLDAPDMPAQHTHHLAPTEPLLRHAGEQVTTGRRAMSGEAIRAALRLMTARQEAESPLLLSQEGALGESTLNV